MDHFAKRGDELEVAQREGKLQRNFQGYSTRAGADIYAFGMTSISQRLRTSTGKTRKTWIVTVRAWMLGNCRSPTAMH